LGFPVTFKLDFGAAPDLLDEPELPVVVPVPVEAVSVAAVLDELEEELLEEPQPASRISAVQRASAGRLRRVNRLLLLICSLTLA
jgi:hypothetical protein